MSCTNVRDVESGLCPGSSICGMRVYDSPDFRKCLIEHKVGWVVGWMRVLDVCVVLERKIYNL